MDINKELIKLFDEATHHPFRVLKLLNFKVKQSFTSIKNMIDYKS